MNHPITPARASELMAALRPDAAALARTPKSGCVEGAIDNALTAALYHRDADVADPLLVAALLFRSLVCNHCFEDGNKRISWLALLEVLWVEAGLTIAADQLEAAELVVKVATRAIDVDELVRWLAERLVVAPGLDAPELSPRPPGLIPGTLSSA